MLLLMLMLLLLRALVIRWLSFEFLRDAPNDAGLTCISAEKENIGRA